METSFITTGRKLLSFIVHGKLRDYQIRSVAILFTFYEIYNSRSVSKLKLTSFDLNKAIYIRVIIFEPSLANTI